MNPLRFVGVAQAVAGLSKDPSTKVGALLLDDDCNVLGVGFNGFPRGVDDSAERYNDRPTKYKLVSHAEQNAIAQAARKGSALAGATLIVTALYPCSSCTKSIIQAGIKKVFAPKIVDNDRWTEDAETSKLMFTEAGVLIEHYDVPDTSPFQARVMPWLLACFGPSILEGKKERNHRFLEESLELVQACNLPREEAHQLVDFVYDRPAGDTYQEVGGVMVTLAALCCVQGLDMHLNGEVELKRVWGCIDKIRAKQLTKPKHSETQNV
jgi:deoxycytidylate deaminase